MKKYPLIISNYDDLKNPFYGGGGAVAVHEVAKRLAKQIDVIVLTGLYPGAVKREVIDGVTYRRVGTSFFGPFVGQLIFWLLLPWFGIREQYSIWIESFTPPFGVSFLPLVAKSPVVGLIHMLPGMDMWRKYKIPFFLFERLGLKWYKNFIVLTEHMKEIIEKYNPIARIDIIPNGVDIPDVPCKKEKHILFLGRIEVNQKGLDLLIKAFSKRDFDVSYPLIIAGGGTDREIQKLKQLLEDVSFVGDRIRYVGKVYGIEKKRLLSEAVMVVIPSRFETFSISALEAFSFGIPVVSFDIPGFCSFPDSCMYRARCFDVDDLSKKVSEAVRSKRSSEWYRDVAVKYQWDSVSSKFLSLMFRISGENQKIV